MRQCALVSFKNNKSVDFPVVFFIIEFHVENGVQVCYQCGYKSYQQIGINLQSQRL